MRLLIAVAVLAVVIAGGWYVSHSLAEKRAQAQKEAEARARKAFDVNRAGTNRNPNPFRGGPPSELKDKLTREAAEREAQKK